MTPLCRRQKPVATVSLDLDNLWAYLKTHENPDWRAWPSFLEIAVPRFLETLAEANLKITVFIVGQDATMSQHQDLLRAISAAGHEIGNHSFLHEPWLASASEAEIADEIMRAEDSITHATGIRPRGFRGPGHALSPAILRVLATRGYDYDASCWPTVITPLLRLWYFRSAGFSAKERQRRRNMGGTWRDSLRSLRPFRWDQDSGSMLELPVTTMPMLRTPIHLTYLQALAAHSEPLAYAYYGAALRLCRWLSVPPSILLHATDFLGSDDRLGLDFIPGMQRSRRQRIAVTKRTLAMLGDQFEVLSLRAFAERVATETRFKAFCSTGVPGS